MRSPQGRLQTRLFPGTFSDPQSSTPRIVNPKNRQPQQEAIMVRLNKIARAFTYEGGRGKRFTPEMELKRALMNCLLWEDQFYEDGVAIADRIKALVPKVEPA